MKHTVKEKGQSGTSGERAGKKNKRRRLGTKCFNSRRGENPSKKK